MHVMLPAKRATDEGHHGWQEVQGVKAEIFHVGGIGHSLIPSLG